MGQPVHFFLRFSAFTAKKVFKYHKKGFFLSFLLKRRSGFFSLALENRSDYHCATTEKVGHPERAVKATLQG
ncbi:MAG: hypothetical protein V3G53_01945, partial [Candidatus Enteromonas sp.]